MLRLTLKCALLIMCLGLTMAGQKKPAQQQPPPPPPQQKQKLPPQTNQTADTEKNKATARRIFDDLWTRGRYELIDTMYEKNAVVHFGNRNEALGEVVAEGKEWRSAFPDLVMRADRVSANGDIVEIFWSGQGTNRGQGRGLPGKGQQAKTEGTSRFRFTNGKIAEVWVDWNESNLRRQLTATDNKSVEKNKATARQVFEELWSQGRADLVDSLYERNAVVHWANRDFRLEEIVSQGKEWRAAFPDLAVHADRITGNGETVEAAWSARGTNRGQGGGFPGKGKPAKTHGMSKFRFNSDGKIAEVWVEWDENDVRRQVAGK